MTKELTGIITNTVKFPYKFHDGFLSELKVLRSAAGFYIGREFLDATDKTVVPGSRESERYWKTEAEAKVFLQLGGWVIRQCIENDAMYAAGITRPIGFGE